VAAAGVSMDIGSFLVTPAEISAVPAKAGTYSSTNEMPKRGSRLSPGLQ